MADEEYTPKADNRSTVETALRITEGDPFKVLRSIERSIAETQARRWTRSQTPYVAQLLAEYADQRRILAELHPEIAEMLKGDPGE